MWRKLGEGHRAILWIIAATFLLYKSYTKIKNSPEDKSWVSKMAPQVKVLADQQNSVPQTSVLEGKG